MERRGGSLEETPTWAVSVVVLVFFVTSFIIDASLHYLSKFFTRKKTKSLGRALKKIKTEMMNLGMVSFLLTVTEVPISRICISEAMAKSFLPCEDAMDSAQTAVAETDPSQSNLPLSANPQEDYCQSKGMVALASREGVLQLNIFISVLAVFHVLFCIFTMFLGKATMKKWKSWEEETKALDYQMANDPRKFRLTRQTSFGKRHLNFCASHPLMVWPACLLRQFHGSVSKADYFTLRNGFRKLTISLSKMGSSRVLDVDIERFCPDHANIAEGTDFDFQGFLARAYDDDFEKVVQMRFWIWIFSMLFIFFNAYEFHNYYWLPFIPLLLLLIVGTKLQVIITNMCVESSQKGPVIRGTFLVNPINEFFWFGRPDWLLHLLQFILIQNSLQLAFFTWSWYEFGLRSCFNRKTEEIAIKIAMGIAVQLLCGYVTLPLYALVTQMGSGMKKTVFTDNVVGGLKDWRKRARLTIVSRNESVLSRQHSFSPLIFPRNGDQERNENEIEIAPPLSRTAICSAQEISVEKEASESNRRLPLEATANRNPKIVESSGIGEGEISFGSSWKKMASQRIREIASGCEDEENASQYV